MKCCLLRLVLQPDICLGMMSSVSLSIVIPTFNEESRLAATLERLRSVAHTFGELEVIITDDGSTDQTIQLAHQWKSRLPLRVLRNAHLGPGAAIRAGVLNSELDWVLLSDADGPVNFLTAHEMVAWANEHNLDVLSGRRVGANAQIAHPQPFYRRAMGHLWRRFVRHGIGASFEDPQCGFKLFRGPCARSVFRDTRSQSFGIHVETMMLASFLGHRVAEYPVCWGDRDGSKIRPFRDAFQMVNEALGARRRLRKSTMKNQISAEPYPS